MFDHRGDSPHFVHPYSGARQLGLEPTFFRQTKQTPPLVDGHLRFAGPTDYGSVVTFDSATGLYTLFTRRGLRPTKPRSIARGGSAFSSLNNPELHQICDLPGVTYQLAQEEPFFDKVFLYASRHGFRSVGIRPMRSHPRIGLVTEDAYLRLESKGVVGVITSEGSLPQYRFYVPV